jgi:RNA polymerase sigma-70 factor (ECF subfamily)
MSLYGSHTDEQLWSLIQKGDEEAFVEIYNRYWRVLLRTAHRILQEKEAAQDVVQNVFISVWMRRSVVNIGNLNAYLQQATRFSVYKAIRERRHDESFYRRLAEVAVDMVADDPLLYKEQQRLLKELVDTLPPDCRQAFLLSREENMTYREIAESLSISEKTVEKRISRSLRVLRAGLTHLFSIMILGL